MTDNSGEGADFASIVRYDGQCRGDLENEPMCGRFTLRTPMTKLAEQFMLPGLSEGNLPELTPRYNIAPTQNVAVVRMGDAGRELAMLRWGLIPSWADDLSIGNRLLNARSETAATKPAFRQAMKKRRCLVPADGFFEWRKVGRAKQPHLIGLADGGLFAIAGLWEYWRRDDQVVESCTLLTTSANELLQPLHDRMPVIVAPQDYSLWLDPELQEAEPLTPLLRPFPAGQMRCIAVNPVVNNARFDTPQCVEAVA
jgi:putative SOS response-associated peptidase YedK